MFGGILRGFNVDSSEVSENIIPLRKFYYQKYSESNKVIPSGRIFRVFAGRSNIFQVIR